MQSVQHHASAVIKLREDIFVIRCIGFRHRKFSKLRLLIAQFNKVFLKLMGESAAAVS
jgi:hypothetical protein